MKIEIEIDNTEISSIIDTLKDQGIDVSMFDVQEALEDYFHGVIEDLEESRIETVIDMLTDNADVQQRRIRDKQVEESIDRQVKKVNKPKGQQKVLWKNG